MLDALAAVVVDSAYASDLARQLDEHLLVDGRPPTVLHVEVREIRTRHDGEYGTGLQLEQRDVHLVCRRITSLGTTTFYVPVSRWPPAAVPTGATRLASSCGWPPRPADGHGHGGIIAPFRVWCGRGG